VLVVQHRTPAAKDVTVELLSRATGLDVQLACEGDIPQPGRVSVFPADRQLVVGPDGRLRGHKTMNRNAADALFTSVASSYGARALGVVLSGANADGAAGVVALKRAGAWIFVQDPRTARSPAMPSAAIATGCVDMVLAPHRIAHALVSFTGWPGATSLLRTPVAPWANFD
jgi:two-component system chemotaxis response regulator CheB